MPVSVVNYTTLPPIPAEQCSHHIPVDQQTMPTTLVISDDQDLRMLLVEGLHRLAYPAVGAPHGTQALACLAQYPIQQVILDLPLSTRTPITTCAEIRRDAADDTEILILSPSTEQTIQMQTPGRGADWYIQKPFRLADLHNALQSLHTRGHRVKLSKN